MNVCVLFNAPSLPTDHPDYAQEAGVLEAVEAVEQGLKAGGHRPIRREVRDDPAAMIAGLREAQSDVVFNLCEGLGGSGGGEAQVAGLLEWLGIPFTGCSSECLALARNKPLVKRVLLGAGIPTPRFYSLAIETPLPAELLQPGDWPRRWIVKPAREDASLGIGPESIVNSADALSERVADVRRRFGPALIEEYIDGREFNVGILALPNPCTLPLAEIEFGPMAHGERLVTYDGKWSLQSEDCRSTPARCPADVAPVLAAAIERFALTAFDSLGCRDYVRVDLRIGRDEQGADQPMLLEINANPDIGPGAGLARMLIAAGTSIGELACRLVEQAQRRGAARL